MATSDGESCSAEDRAVGEWRSQWKNIASWTLEDAFRAGFHAGQEHGAMTAAEGFKHGQSVGELPRDGAVYAKRLDAVGEQISKIRDRLNALDQRPESDHRGRFMGIEQRLDSITERANEQGKCIEALKVEEEKDCEAIGRLHKRLEALEATRTSERYAEAVLNGLSERIDNLDLGAREHMIESSIAAITARANEQSKSIAHIRKQIAELSSEVDSDMTSLRYRTWGLEKDTTKLRELIATIESKLRLLEPIG